MISEYRHVNDPKGPTIHAVKVTEENAKDVAQWCGGLLVEELHPFTGEKTPGINVPGIAGNTRASLDWYVLRSVDGTFEAASTSWFETFFVEEEDSEAVGSPDRIDNAAYSWGTSAAEALFDASRLRRRI